MLLVIILLAIWVRAYNYSDWLLMRADQARDGYYAKEAFDNGLDHLRLLGPKVDLAYLEGDKLERGNTLHLAGPFYYYIQYFSVSVFNTMEPWVVALPDLVFFLLSIPLFFLLARTFFSKTNSLLLTTLYAFSFFNIIYSRFAWNPNHLYFWIVLFVLSMARVATEKENKKKGWWFLTAVFGFLIISQLHFLALAGFFIVGIIFWIILRKRIKISKKYWLAALAIVLILNIPLAVSEYKNRGDNVKRYLVAMTRERETDDTLYKKISTTMKKQGEFFSISLTSFHEEEIAPIEMMGLVLFLISIGAFIFHLVKKKEITTIKNQKVLFVLLLLWSGVFLLLFFRIYFKLNNARYYIMLVPMSFLFLGFWLAMLEKIRKKGLGILMMIAVSLTLLAGNLNATAYFYESLQAGYKAEKYSRDPKLGPYRELITLGEMRQAYIFMTEEAKKENKEACFRNSNYQYNLGFKYIADVYHSVEDLRSFNVEDEALDCKYFYTTRAKRGAGGIDEEFLGRFERGKPKQFGAMIVWEMNLKEGEIKKILAKNVEEVEKPKKKDDEKRIIIWKEVFNGKE